MHTIFLAPDAVEQDSTPSVRHVVIDGDEGEEPGDGDDAQDARTDTPPPPEEQRGHGRGSGRNGDDDEEDGDDQPGAGGGAVLSEGGGEWAAESARAAELSTTIVYDPDQTTVAARDSTLEESDDALTLTTEVSAFFSFLLPLSSVQNPLQGRRATKRFNVTTDQEDSTIKVTRRTSYRVAARKADTSV